MNEKQYKFYSCINFMRFFWILIAATVIAISLNLIYQTGLEIVILLLLTDFMALWIYAESDKEGSGNIILIEKIGGIERLISDLFNKMSKKFSNGNNDKKEIIEWLNKF